MSDKCNWRIVCPDWEPLYARLCDIIAGSTADAIMESVAESVSRDRAHITELEAELAAAKVRIGELKNYQREAETCIARYAHECDVIKASAERAESSLFTANAEIDWMRARIANVAIEVLKTNKDARVRQVEARANIALESMRNEVQVLREALEKIENKLDWVTTDYSAEGAIRKIARAALAQAKVKEEGND